MAKIVQNPRLQHACFYCDKLFHTIADYLTHIKTKHEIKEDKTVEMNWRKKYSFMNYVTKNSNLNSDHTYPHPYLIGPTQVKC